MNAFCNPGFAGRLRARDRVATLFVLVLLAGPALVACSGAVRFNDDWRTADRTSAGLSAPAADVPEAIVQVYAARAFNWRGIFAVHTWIATKPRDAAQYTVHQVLGWRRYDDLPVVESIEDLPDRSWYGQPPHLLAEVRGIEAERLMEPVLTAIRTYPFADRYVLWPGPNSNTFTAWVARQVPELRLDLPPTAIGKDWLGAGRFVTRAPSGTGVQFSLFGLLGVLAAQREGIEFNVLGVSFGANPFRLEARLPGIGVVRPARAIPGQRS
jgi:hypothetical protein